MAGEEGVVGVLVVRMRGRGRGRGAGLWQEVVARVSGRVVQSIGNAAALGFRDY